MGELSEAENRKLIEWGKIGVLTHFVSEIFVEPERWGLRGDPLLWKYLKSYYATIEVPYPVECLEKDILRIFKDFTGELPTKGKHYFVKEFSETHVGMSTGCLSANFLDRRSNPITCQTVGRYKYNFPFIEKLSEAENRKL